MNKHWQVEWITIYISNHSTAASKLPNNPKLGQGLLPATFYHELHLIHFIIVTTKLFVFVIKFCTS